MKARDWSRIAIAGIAGVCFGAVGAHRIASGQAPAAKPDAPPAPAAARRVVRSHGGALTVVRISDTAFVVVKDHGDAQTTQYFDTSGGFPVLRGGAKRFPYAK